MKIKNNENKIRCTTILSVRKNEEVAIAGDGQVTFGSTQIKSNAKKVRKFKNSEIIAGFSGIGADALSLFDFLEKKLEQYPNQMTRACVEFVKDWRNNKYLRKLESFITIADKERTLILSGGGEILEPEDKIIGIGSGGTFALAAAKAMYLLPLSAKEIAIRSVNIAADICIYTNHTITIESIRSNGIINTK